MKAMIILTFFLFMTLSGCSSLTLKPGDFSWPIESELKVNEKGMVEDNQYYFSINVKELLYDETQDSVNISNITIRIIRNFEGYYFITGKNFKNVYVFEQIESGMKLVNKIIITQDGIGNPQLNQRPPYIQLLNGKNPPVYITKDGIQEGEKK
jgi:hypothetical protein